MNIIEKKIYNISPGYHSDYKGLIKQYSQFGGGAEGEKYHQGRYFSNVYEFYLYAFFLGIKKELKYDLHADDRLNVFWEIVNWKPKELVDHLLVCAIEKSDFDMLEIQNMDESELSLEIRKLKSSIEEYANGGFKFISEKVQEDPDQAEQDDFFIKLLA